MEAAPETRAVSVKYLTFTLFEVIFKQACSTNLPAIGTSVEIAVPLEDAQPVAHSVLKLSCIFGTVSPCIVTTAIWLSVDVVPNIMIAVSEVLLAFAVLLEVLERALIQIT